jgi:hypothetical protein
MTYSKYVLFIALLSTQSMVYAQTQVLKNYDFDKGGYSLIGIRSESEFNQLAHDLDDFYTDNIEVLNAIKKEWTFKKPTGMYACGYHYYVSVCKNGLELERFAINLSCHEIVANKRHYYFEEQQLGRFKDQLKKLSKRDFNRWERYNLPLYDYHWRYHTQWYDLIKSE